MKGILVDESVKVYAEPNDQTISVTSMRKGDEFELGKVSRKKRQVWVEVTLASGQTGYIAGETKIFTIKKVQLLNDQVALSDAPNSEGQTIKTFPKNTLVTAIGVEDDQEKGWVKVVDNEGVTGFIKGDARIKIYQEPSKSDGKKQMLYGGVFAILGAAYYIYSINQAQGNSNMSILIIAVMAFGLMQFVQGFLQYNRAKKKENEKK